MLHDGHDRLLRKHGIVVGGVGVEGNISSSKGGPSLTMESLSGRSIESSYGNGTRPYSSFTTIAIARRCTLIAPGEVGHRRDALTEKAMEVVEGSAGEGRSPWHAET